MKIPRIPTKHSRGRNAKDGVAATVRDKAGPAGMYMSILGKEAASLVGRRRTDRKGPSDAAAIPSPASLPPVERRIRIAATDDAAFRRVVAAREGECAHGGYLHAVTFPIAMELMSKKSFPLRLLGLIHLENSVTQHRPVTLDTTVKVRVRVKEFGSHRRGTTVRILAEIWDSSGELAYTDESLYLSKQPSGDAEKRDSAPASGASARENRPDPRVGLTLIGQWRLPSTTGRAYAKVSGDANPIHLSNTSAKLFGMKGAIAHGMYCASRALSQVTSDPSAPCEWTVEFGAPVQLPSTVRIWRDLSSSTNDKRTVLRGVGPKKRKNFEFSWQSAGTSG
jgi:acyl dehydratase